MTALGEDPTLEHVPGDVWEREGVRVRVMEVLLTSIGVWLTLPRPLGRRAVDDMVAAGWTRVEREPA